MRKSTMALIAVSVIGAGVLTAATVSLLGRPAALPAVRYSEPSVTVAPEERVNVNTATQQQLESLPGIGPVIAAAIIAYREESGGFAALEELLEVKGIGEARLEALEPYIEVS